MIADVEAGLQKIASGEYGVGVEFGLRRGFVSSHSTESPLPIASEVQDVAQECSAVPQVSGVLHKTWKHLNPLCDDGERK